MLHKRMTEEVRRLILEDSVYVLSYFLQFNYIANSYLFISLVKDLKILKYMKPFFFETGLYYIFQYIPGGLKLMILLPPPSKQGITGVYY
jgi:hypothetical protein